MCCVLWLISDHRALLRPVPSVSMKICFPRFSGGEPMQFLIVGFDCSLRKRGHIGSRHRK